MSPRPIYLPLSISTFRSPCHCFFTNASTTKSAAIAAAMTMTESVRKYQISRRTFMSTPPQHHISPEAIMEQNTKRKARNIPNTKLQMKKETASANIHSDLGLLPETFIMPSGKNLPSIFNDPRTRWRFEWKRVKAKLQNFTILIVYKYAESLRPRPNLELRQRKKIALELYKLMNEAIAEKDVATLRSICTDGIFNSVRTRISWRDPEENLYWSLASPSSSSGGIINRLLGKPNIKASIVSDRATTLPYPYSSTSGPRNRLRQMVVRLDSAQKLVRWRWKHNGENNNDDVLESATPPHTSNAQKKDTSASTSAEDDIKREILARTPDPKDPPHQHQQQQDLLNKVDILSATGVSQPHQSTEYLVLQQLLVNGVQEPWSIWGTAEETTIEVLDRWEKVGYADCNDDGDDKHADVRGSNYVSRKKFYGLTKNEQT